MNKVLTIILVLVATAAFTQNKDIKATQFLDEVTKTTKSHKSIKADFSYTMENKQSKINETKSGTLLLSGEKYKLIVAGQTVICDGKTIWTYIKESNEVQINDVDAKEDALTPSRLLSSYSNYKSRIIKEKSQPDPNTESVELIPNVVKNFTKAILIVDKNKKQVKSFILYDKNGNTFTYKVTNYQTDIPVSNADFAFVASKFPGVEVIDMR